MQSTCQSKKKSVRAKIKNRKFFTRLEQAILQTRMRGSFNLKLGTFIKCRRKLLKLRIKVEQQISKL